jgi:predicted dehydrogenase
MKWGVIATGGIAQAVTADMLKVEGVTVLAVSSRDKSRAHAFAERFGIERAYGDYHDLLADPDVDVVYVATPHGQHKEVTLAALDAGKHVLCEKAFALTVADAEEMIERARSKNLFLMEAMWTRFNPLIRKVHEAVRVGSGRRRQAAARCSTSASTRSRSRTCCSVSPWRSGHGVARHRPMWTPMPVCCSDTPAAHTPC